MKMGEEKEDDDGKGRKWRSVREERPVKMEEGREERLFESKDGGREG